MDYHITCTCGKTLRVHDGMAGSAAPCLCGRMVAVPSLSVLRGEAIAESRLPSGSAPGAPGDLPRDRSEPAPVVIAAHVPSVTGPPQAPAEILPPAAAKLQVDRGISLGRQTQVMAA